MQDYSKLNVWQKAHDLVLHIYTSTRGFPVHERYGLTTQLRRSATSIACNLAEGCGSSSRAGFIRFLDIAASSASEADYQLLLSRDLSYLKPGEYDKLATNLRLIRRMLASLRRTLAATARGQPGTAVAVTND
jgi:four helix bundle protein